MSEQRALALEMLLRLETVLFVRFATNPPPALGKLALDGFAAGSPPTLVEVFAHVGRARRGERHAIAHAMTKLLLAERRLAVPCRKVIAVIDAAALAHLDKGWGGDFAREFGIELKVLAGFEDRHDALRAARAR